MGVSAPIAQVSVHCLIWLIIFEVTDFIGGSSRTLKCNSIYLKKGPLISFWEALVLIRKEISKEKEGKVQSISTLARSGIM